MNRKIQLHFNDYNGQFYRKDKKGRWYRFHTIGNAGVAFDVAGLLIKLGHDVEFIVMTDEYPNNEEPKNDRR